MRAVVSCKACCLRPGVGGVAAVSGSKLRILPGVGRFIAHEGLAVRELVDQAAQADSL
jgi:hypothetical protein